ncbi:Rhs family protein (fragment) [Tenacibaculum maritimum]|uniref:RHS repeat-associated core domain-containing protein n=1 Tax=Tenacibaculum maritimum TaxID=107401 RepID=UPI0012E6570B
MQSIIDSATGTTEFQYSKTGHLTYAKFGNGTVQHRTADKVGNLFDSPNKKDRTYNYRNRLEKKGNWHYKYDDVGNLIEKYKKKKGLFESKTQHWKYKWNDAGMLQEVIRPDKEKVSFKYDPLGRRIRKVFKKTTTCWVWNGHVPLHEWKQYQQRHYTDEGIRADKIVKHHKITWIFDEGSFIPSGKIKDNKKFSILANHLGTPTQMYDEEGEQVWERSLDLNGKVINGSNAPCPFLYQGQYYDKEIELAYNRFRYYDPDDGRYISKDPIGLLSGEYGFYNYVGDSNTYIDVFGLSSYKPIEMDRSIVGDKINPNTQKKHIPTSNEYKVIVEQKGKYKSVLTADSQKLLDDFHKGEFDVLSHQEGTKSVLVNFNKNIGTLLDENTGGEIGKSNFGSIKYGKNKVHITPQNV